MDDYEKEWSGNRTESLWSAWLYIFSLGTQWKAPNVIFCSVWSSTEKQTALQDLCAFIKILMHTDDTAVAS